MTELEGLHRLAILITIQTIVMIFGLWGIDRTLNEILRKIGG